MSDAYSPVCGPYSWCLLPTARVRFLQPICAPYSRCVLPTPVGALGLLRYSCLFFLCLSQTGQDRGSCDDGKSHQGAWWISFLLLLSLQSPLAFFFVSQLWP